ncbi:MAG: amino acid adenylation domain-containing protein [Acidobacteriota bacterium]
MRAKLAAQPEDRQTYGLLRYLKDAPAAGALAARRKPEILFNYLGQLDVALPPDALLTPIDEPSGPPRAPGAQRRHPIELNASVIGDRLRLECRFPSRRLSPDLAKTLSRGWLDHLSTLVDDATRSVKRGVAPADAPADFGLSPSERGGIDPIEAVYPLSPTQEGMLFHSLYAPESGVYVGQVSLRIDGRFDTRAFLAAWERLLDRHAALRTAFIWADREAPLQQVRARAELTIERRDWRGRTTPHRDEAWRDLLATDRQRGYDLAEAPLIRLFLIRQSETSWRFLWSYHHIILDGWSLAILFEELFALYRDADASDLPARRPYGDYLHHLARRDTDAEQRYWQRRLEGLGAPTPLGLERSAARRTAPSEAEEKPARGRVVRVLGPRRTRRLQGLARRAEIPLNTLVQGAWALLLARYADQSEVVFGTVLAGRSPLLRGAESMVGLFINTLPVRCDVAPEAPAADWLRQLRDDLLELRDFEATPLVRVQGWANAWNDLPAGQALFDSLVAFENYPIDEALRQQADGLEIHQVEAFERSNYPLGLQAVPEGRTTSAEARPASGEVGRLVLQLHFDRQRFATTAVGRLGEQLETAIHALAEAGDRRLGELPWLSPAERHQTLVEWNYPFHGFTRQSLMGHGTTEHDLLPQLFATSVSRRGDAVAVRADQVLTYAELDARSRRLAARLVALGAGPETVIGLCLERSPEMIVALLAIVRSGSVFLPLDPSYPQERLAYMLADAAAPLLITRSGLRAQLPTLRKQLAGLRENLAGQHEQSAEQHEQSVGPRKILCIDEPGLFDAPDDAASDALSTLPTCAPHHAAYLIYTSGSTGRPKGVVISHGALANLLRYRRLGLGPEQVQLQRTSLSFDIGLAESFLPLVFGSCLVLAPASRELGNTELARLIGRHRITLASFTPSLLETFLESQALTDCPSLRLVSCGAETMPADLPNRFFAQSRAELRNRYGPTEATIYMAEWRCSPDERSPVPIGRPAAGARILLLDREARPIPIDATGELYVGGPGLARGYLRRPARTAVAFVPDPFGQIPGERLYRTGDLARCWPDGAVEFLGRRDQQVKVRGVRIELGEIEATLAAHPAVRQAAVIDLPDVTGDSRRLVACLVTDPTLATATELHGLRGYLGQRLPEAMVPSAFTPVDTLPRTPSGKVDRAALARTVAEAPDTSPVDDLSPTAGAPPRDPVEELMVEIWHEILGRDTATLADAAIADATIADATIADATIADATIGIHDDFFDLGGHSLLATRVVSRVRSAFSVELPLRQLFEAPTVAGLSAAVRQRLEGGQPAAQEPIERLERDPSGPDAPRLALSFAQERLWFLDRMEPGNSAYNVPAAIRLHGTLDVPVLAGCLAEIVRRHASLRTHFEAPAGEPRQVIESAITAPLPLIDLSALGDSARATELAQWSADEANRPFDLLRGPLFRFTLLRLQPNEHAALLTLHHIVSDAWSMETLVRECVLLYRTTLSGQPSPLSEIDVQYADFAAWQRQRLSDDFIARELRYWRRTLDGAPPLLELPTDRPRGAVQSRHGARASLRLPRGLAVELHRASRAADATLFMTLLAAFQALLHRLSGQPDICIGSPIAGRTHEELQGLIGFFVNTLVLRGSLGRDLDFRRHLDATRHACLGAYAHQELPFERLVAELHPERSLSHTPLFQVMLVFQSRLLDLPALPELHFERLHVDSGREQMGMITLQMAEDDDGLLALLDFNRDLFDPTTMARLLARFHNLLAVVARQPHLALGSIPLLSPAERHQAAYEWNDTATPGTLPGTDATPRTLLDLLAEPLARTPDAVAILAGGEHLSYGELHRRANRLANHLRHLGVGPEARVALCLERSTEAITALLAVWKAGGAYLPLDPAVPAERLAFTLEDAGATVLLSDATQAAAIPGTRARVVLLDQQAASIDTCDATPPEVPLTPRNLAYVIYTSGSTGRPKGVLVQHASVLAIVRSFLDSYELAPRDRVLQQTTLTFDVSVNEIFPVLAAGGGLVLEPPSTGIDLERRIRRVAEQRVSILSAAPSLLARLDEAAADLGSLRLVLSGGEALALGDVERLRAGATVVNGYGPTEATVCCLAYDLAEMQSDEPKIPIGRPLRETEILLLDQAGLRLAIGQAGEVCVAGAGLARGYLRRPGRTAAAFTPHPEGLGQQGVGQRIYRTGDLARYLPDGNLLFLGRRDHQVKIRGFRIELGEIEAALAAHPQAREVAVIVREDTPGNQRLVAYLTGDSAPEPVVLRTYLEARLPSYMVPSAFVHLDTLPLSTSGKVDQEALPVPDTSAEEIVGPRDDTERALLRIWEDLLGISPISVKADFFDLGGHSLLVVRLTARIKKELDRSVPVAAIFQEPTIERLAALLRHEIAFDWAPLVTLQSAGSKPPLFCVHPIGGEVIAYHRLAEHLGEEQPFYALQAPFAVATAERDLPIEEVAAFYLEKIRPVQATGPYFLGGYSYGCVITFEMAQQLRRAGEEVALVALIDGIFPGRSIGRRILELPQLNWRRAKAAAEYRPRPYPGRLTYFRAERGERQSAWARFHNLRRWKRLSGEPMEVQPISGNHAQCIREPWVATLAERLEATIDRITLRPLSTAAGGRRSREP